MQVTQILTRCTKLLVVLSLTGITCLAIAAEPTKPEITFKGIRFDIPGEMEKVKQMCLESVKNEASSKCTAKSNPEHYGVDQTYFKTSYGSLNEGVIFYNGTDDTLIGVSILYQVEELMTLIEPLKAKYGEPKISPFVVEMKNRANVAREILTWTDSRGTVMILNTAARTPQVKADLRYGRLSIESAQLRTIEAKVKDATTSAIKDDL